MSEVLKNLGSNKRPSKKENDRAYEEYLSDPLTYSLDEILQTLGPRKERI